MDDVVFEPITGPAHQVWDDPASVWTAPIVEGAADGARPATTPMPMVERLRIRGGFLRYGFDVDEDHFPFETPLARFLDYGKGCYVGQEPVFRVHAQGNAARMLRGLPSRATAPIAPGTALAAPAKGQVTSSVGDGDATRALGYLHRTCWEPGGTVEVAGRKATRARAAMVTEGVSRLAALVVLPLAGCTLIADSFLTNEFSGDPFPTTVDSSSGALLVGIQPSDESAPRHAVLDLLSPFTLVDPLHNVDPSLRRSTSSCSAATRSPARSPCRAPGSPTSS